MSHKTERSWPSLKQRSSGRRRIAKAIIAQFDGKQPTYSYFDGCSDGGREALMEAQRYPNDVDGIVAGAPANDVVVQNTIHHAWNVLANRDANGNPILLAGKLPLIHGAVVAACDRLDGVADWLINDPRRCHSDPASLLCSPGQDGTSCLTDAEAGVVRRLHDDATDAQGHRLEQRVSHEWRSELDWALFVPAAPGQPRFSESIALLAQHFAGEGLPAPVRGPRHAVDRRSAAAARSRFDRGIDTLQTRTRALDGTLWPLFKRWCPRLADDNPASVAQAATA